MPRFYCPTLLQPGALLELPATAARHVQVLRLQPGDGVTLFDGAGHESSASVTHMGRSQVQVRLGELAAVSREPARAVHLAVGMPANERMDWLVEKATELGAASIQPLITERSVLRLSGERADKKRQHWQSVAVAACEQCGGNRLPVIHPVQTLAQWLAQTAPLPGRRAVLSLQPQAQPWVAWAHAQTAVEGVDGGGLGQPALTFLSGPEGGLSPAEEAQAHAAGFTPVTLGPRVLRAETAALAALAVSLLGG
jgi:16S rRNA (uracil1498-N3)-methyltransferase